MLKNLHITIRGCICTVHKNLTMASLEINTDAEPRPIVIELSDPRYGFEQSGTGRWILTRMD